jgi:hypothetical protein
VASLFVCSSLLDPTDFESHTQAYTSTSFHDHGYYSWTRGEENRPRAHANDTHPQHQQQRVSESVCWCAVCWCCGSLCERREVGNRQAAVGRLFSVSLFSPTVGGPQQPRDGEGGRAEGRDRRMEEKAAYSPTPHRCMSADVEGGRGGGEGQNEEEREQAAFVSAGGHGKGSIHHACLAHQTVADE